MIAAVIGTMTVGKALIIGGGIVSLTAAVMLAEHNRSDADRVMDKVDNLTDGVKRLGFEIAEAIRRDR